MAVSLPVWKLMSFDFIFDVSKGSIILYCRFYLKEKMVSVQCDCRSSMNGPLFDKKNLFDNTMREFIFYSLTLIVHFNFFGLNFLFFSFSLLGITRRKINWQARYQIIWAPWFNWRGDWRNSRGIQPLRYRWIWHYRSKGTQGCYAISWFWS